MTFVAVGDDTTSTTGNGKTGGGGTGGSEARASRPRAREATIITRAATITGRKGRGVAASWSEGISSPAELIAYTRDGEWVPGEQAPWLERAGKAYGYGIALPATLLLLALAWVVQRPSRFALALVAVVVVVLTWLPLTAGGDQPPAPAASSEVTG